MALFTFDPKDHPTQPGVYLFRNDQARVLYVGKARNLRQRLRSYAQGGDGRPNIPVMLRHAVSVETIVTASEVEALILENNLIKEHRPRYNLFFKDDKSYPFIRVTRETVPRIFLTRRQVRDGSRYFGPYTDVKHLRSFLTEIKEQLRIRDCDLSITEESVAQNKHRVCLNYHIGKCGGPCEGKEDLADYARRVELVVDILKGRAAGLRRDAERRMREAAATLEYEEAARQRDTIAVLDQFMARQKAERGVDEDLDVIALAVEDNDACCALLRVRGGRILGRYHSFLNGALKAAPEELVSRFLEQYYSQCEDLPPLLLVPVQPGDTELISTWLSERRGAKCELRWPQRGEKVGLLKLGESNAQMLLSNLQLARMKRERIPETLKALQRDLDLPALPRRIEGFDISHFMGESTVASLVVFVDGKPRRSEYRHFHVRTVSGIDDFASMEEVVRRRYTRRLREETELPDLILIDGGKGQLGRAAYVLRELGLERLPVIGLAKRLEEVFVPGESEPRNLPKISSANRLLQHVRDEAHHFAITFNRKLRRQAAIVDPLEQIPGLGPKTQERLLSHFGSLGKIKAASVEELCTVQGIGRKLAELIHSTFHS